MYRPILHVYCISSIGMNNIANWLFHFVVGLYNEWNTDNGQTVPRGSTQIVYSSYHTTSI